MYHNSDKRSSASFQNELSIRSESIQRIYNFYANQRFYVNRRYQRKLVWTIEEKKAFIDSILQGFPVPIILLAETEKDHESVYEIIDGMQRLNAVIAFIEGEFDILRDPTGQPKYFDLQTMVESKSLLDQGKLQQKKPLLDRTECEILASYVLPLSVYQFNDNEKVDEIFRRINSNGKHLSRQDLRAAGATTNFPELVRKISSEIRTDTSALDVLLLNSMKEISITNKQLDYGIVVDDIFWVKNNIIRKEMVRESRDEEIVADLVAYITLRNIPPSSSEILDEYYGLKDSKRKDEIEKALLKNNPEIIRQQFLSIYNEIRKIIHESGKKFSGIISDQNPSSIPRYFQVVFLSLYELIFKEKMEIASYGKLSESLLNVSSNISINQGGNWSSANKKKNISAVSGIIRDCFKPRSQNDPATDNWLTEFETLLSQSKTEQSLYDFKQGFTRLDGKKEFDTASFNKMIKTLTAMANHSPHATGYVCVGVADNDRDAQRVQEIYGIQSETYKGFKITGIYHEAENLQGDLDKFQRWLIQQLQQQPIEQTIRDRIGQNMRLIRYYEKDILLIGLKADRDPIAYDGKFYQRIGSNLDEIPLTGYSELFRRFIENP
jgi:hypothetical protein